MSEKTQEALKLQFDKWLRLEFHGAQTTGGMTKRKYWFFRRSGASRGALERRFWVYKPWIRKVQ